MEVHAGLVGYVELLCDAAERTADRENELFWSHFACDPELAGGKLNRLRLHLE
jgi:hypothetical protein